ncbi:zinc finger protein 595-like [Anopheles bellator]|uniref:zinc finger protein 595-like n=1 Tax=Anopheles bellator TaxID=139047 RepID=UPI00264721A5|nr:zinc finger protein 595-like [Anopheles bellator]
MESKGLIRKGDGVESAKICRWCLTAGDALEALMLDGSGQYKVQKIFDFTDVQLELSPGIQSYLCTTCESRLEKMDTFRWRCNEKSDTVDKFIKRQNTVENVSEIAPNHLDHSAQKTIVPELTIKTEVTTPDAATDLHLIQRSCTAPQVNGTHECYGKQSFEAEENSITIKLECVDVDELYRLQTNAILDHEQDDLRTNPLELVCQDREDHSMSMKIYADGTELLIKTEATTPDAATDLHLNQKCTTVHEANMTYECCGTIPDDLFEAEENPIAIKSEYEEDNEQHQLQTTNDVLDHDPKKNPEESIGQDQKYHPVTVADNTCADTSAAEPTQNVLNRGTRNAHSKSHSKNHKHRCPHCSAAYPFLNMLKNHIRTHTGEKPYKCKVCDKAFHLSTKLTKHSKIHNKDQQHQCPYCSFMVAQSYNLKIHIRTHTGEKPYKCKVCDKTFHSPSTLAKHSKIHNKDQHHQCPHCLSMFVELSNLKVHIRTHTGEMPYKCKFCDKAFSTSSNLVKHSKIHKKGKTN